MCQRFNLSIHTLAKVRKQLCYAARNRAMPFDLARPRSLARIVGKGHLQAMTFAQPRRVSEMAAW